jgi:Protein of unknown function (DUF3014)
MELTSIPKRRRTGRRRILALAVVLVTAGVAAYFLRQPVALLPQAVPPVAEEAPPPPVPQEGVPAPPETPPPAEPDTVPEAAAEPALPPLSESDPFARELARTLSQHPALAGWLATDGLIRRFVAAVDDVAEGESPRPQLGFLAPAERFRVIQRGGRVFLDPRSYARYDKVADVFASLDPQGCAEAYRRLQPLLEEAHRELGSTDRSFDAALRAAIARLLATPVMEGDVELKERVISYDFAAPALEERSAAEKQLLRMGPRNVRRIQEQLRAIAAPLGMGEGGTRPPPEGAPR